MENTYIMSRFDPEHPELAIESREITAGTEVEAYRLIGEPIDGTYWQIIEPQP